MKPIPNFKSLIMVTEINNNKVYRMYYLKPFPKCVSRESPSL